MRAPALNPLAVWKVEQRGRPDLRPAKSANSRSHAARRSTDAPGKIVIVGGGAAGFAAAEMLRRQEFRGSIVMLSNDAAPPVDRPNLSKDYLAGSAPEDWLPLRPDELLRGERHRLAARTASRGDRYRSARRHHRRWRAPLPTTGCCWRRAPSRCGCRSPAPTSRMSIPCARSPIAGPSSSAPRARAARVVIGASFIGLEVAAALRAREHRGSRGGAGATADGAHARARRWATSCARCMRSTALSFISRIPWPRSTGGARRSRAAA